MARLKLTQVAVDRLAPPKAGAREVFDRVLPAFGLRLFATGSGSWFVFYRDAAGKQRRHTIGSLAAIPKVDDARKRAREVLTDVGAGNDPAASRRPGKAITVKELAAEFMERHVKAKNRSWPGTEAAIRQYILPPWGKREAAAITKRDVHQLLDGLVDAGHVVLPNRVLALVRKMFAWACEKSILEASPAAGVKAPLKEAARERVLTTEEVARLWGAADRDGGVAGAMVKLLMLTGQRRSEVANMRWADIDGDVWTVPVTKAGRTHQVPLSPLAVEVIGALPHLGEYVLAARTGTGPIAGFSKMKARIDALAGFDGWRLHDLRRTAGTGMAERGVPVSTISRVLNHSEGGMTRIYNRYSYLDEKRRALELWASRIEALVRPVAGNVVQIRA